MKKKLYLIGGTMGVGKTTTCQIIKNTLNNCVFLDGDRCWDMHPFMVTDETKVLVLDNICHLLNNFIKCSAFENIVFCWVMHEQAVIDSIVSRLDAENCEIISISLVCNPTALAERLQKDIDNKKRSPDIIGRSTARLPMYETLNTYKLDVSEISAAEAAEKIITLFSGFILIPNKIWN